MPQQPTAWPSDPAAVARIRRVTVSGAIDEALRVVHDDSRALFLVSGAVMVVPAAIAFHFGVPPLEELLEGFFDLLEGSRVDFLPLLKRLGYATLPTMFLAYRVAEPLALGALVLLSAGLLTGRRATPKSAVSMSVRCSVALIVMWLLRWLLIQLGTQLCYVPGIIIAGLYFSALPALIIERIGPFRAMGRSVELNKDRMFEAVVLVLLLGLIDFLLTPIAHVLPSGVPQALGIGFVHSGVLVLYAAASTVFYFSGRCQFEDLDLQLWVQTVAGRDELDPPADVTTLFSPQPTA